MGGPMSPCKVTMLVFLWLIIVARRFPASSTQHKPPASSNSSCVSTVLSVNCIWTEIVNARNSNLTYLSENTVMIYDRRTRLVRRHLYKRYNTLRSLPVRLAAWRAHLRFAECLPIRFLRAPLTYIALFTNSGSWRLSILSRTPHNRLSSSSHQPGLALRPRANGTAAG